MSERAHNKLLGEQMKSSLLLLFSFIVFSGNTFSQITNDEDSLRLLGAYVQRADSAQNRGDYESSERDRRTIVSILRSIEFNPAEIARQLSNLASVLNINSKPLEAEKVALEAKELLARNRTDDMVQLAVLSGNLAQALKLQGKLDQAQSEFEQELEILTREGLEDSHFAASAKVGLGAIESERGNFEKAFKYYEEAIPIFLSISDESHPVTKKYLQEFEQVRSKLENN